MDKMALNSIFKAICQQLSIDAELHVQSQWGSQNSNHRQMIRNAIAEKYKVLSMDKYPILASGDVSISHSNNLGGFIYSPTLVVGFDIEEVSRISPKTVARIASPQEIAESPSVEILWAAKESLFKSIKENFDISLISQLQLLNWQKFSLAAPHLIDAEIYLSEGALGQTVSWIIDTHVFSFSFHNKS
jgi:phosphopantetheinyl transferase (holo-ACP synthase)